LSRLHDSITIKRLRGKMTRKKELAPRELGGTNALANLAAQPKDEARGKDRDENRLHAEVCTGGMTLPAARAAIARRWTR
jgi:hypothetical protein